MECLRLQLINFCQHRNLVVDFVTGLNGILGANGSGKSNVINAIRYAITGLNYNAGTKTDNINSAAHKKESSKVVLEFRHAGHTYVIERNLKAVKPDATLHRDGQLLLSGNTPVTVELLNILGISLDLFNDVVVAGQDDLYGFISHKPAQRAEKFQTLFQTKMAETVYDATGDWLKKNPVADHLSNLQAAMETRDRLSRDLNESENLKLQLPSEESLRAVIAAAKTASEYSGRLVTTRRYLAEAQQCLALLKDSPDYAGQVGLAWNELQQAEAEAAKLQGQQSAAVSRLNQAAWVTKRNTQRRQIQQQQSSVAARAITLPMVPADVMQKAERDSVVANQDYGMNVQMSRTLRTQLDGLAVDGKCPTCGHVSEDGAKLRHALASQLTDVTAVIAIAQADLAKAEHQVSSLREHEIGRQRNTALMASLHQQLEQIGHELEQEIDVADAAQVSERLAQSQQSQQFSHKTWTALNGIYQRWLADTAASQQSAASLQQELASLEANPAVFTEDPARVQLASNQLLAHAQLAAVINLRSQELALIEEQVSSWQTVCSLEEKDRQWRAVMDGVRQFMHKTGLPAMVASRNMKVIQDEMNRFLAVFSANFRTFSEDGVTFTARFFDGKEQPVERLSGGQKVITALSFRLAVNRLLASNVGLLILDEPTVYQDEHNIQAFAPTLERLRQFSATRGLQCIIVTHEKELAGHCENVIQLP